MRKLPVKLEITDGNNMTAAMLRRANVSMSDFRFHILTAAEFKSEEDIIFWFNSMAYHTAPLSLDLMHNAMLGDQHSIHVTNAPFPRQIKLAGMDADKAALTFVAVIYFIMSIYAVKYVCFYLEVCTYVTNCFTNRTIV